MAPLPARIFVARPGRGLAGAHRRGCTGRNTDSKDCFLAWAGHRARQGSEPVASVPEALAYPPARWRANRPARNHPAFATPFACKPTATMTVAKPSRAGLWR